MASPEVKVRAADADQTLQITVKLKDSLIDVGSHQQQLIAKMTADRDVLQKLKSELEEFQKGYNILRHGLAKGKSEIDRHKARQKDRRVKGLRAMTRMVRESADALVALCIQSWKSTAVEQSQERAHQASRNRKADKHKDWMDKKKKESRTLLARLIAVNDIAQMRMTWGCWKSSVAEEAAIRETEKQVKAMEAKVKDLQVKQRREARMVLDRMSLASEQGMCNLALDCWAELVRDEKKAREESRIMKAQEETLRAKLMARTAEARAVLERNLMQGATVMVRKTLATWKSWVADEVKDRELATANAAALKAFQETNRAQAMQVITRMNCSNENILIEACFENWAWIFKEAKEDKLHQATLKGAQAQLEKLQDTHRFRAMSVVARMSGKQENIFKEACFETWVSHWREEKRDRELTASNMLKLEHLQHRKRDQALSVVARMAGNQRSILLETVVLGWMRSVACDQRLKLARDLRAQIDVEIMELETQVRNREEEKEDLEEELKECRRKNWEIKEHFQEMYELHHSLNQNCDDMMLED